MLNICNDNHNWAASQFVSVNLDHLKSFISLPVPQSYTTHPRILTILLILFPVKYQMVFSLETSNTSSQISNGLSYMELMPGYGSSYWFADLASFLVYDAYRLSICQMWSSLSENGNCHPAKLQYCYILWSCFI